MPFVDEQALHQDLCERRQEALSTLIEDYGPTVYALIEKVLGSGVAALDVEECVSETFWRVWQRIEQYDPRRSSLRTFVLMHAKYAALDWRRHSPRPDQDLPPSPVSPVPPPLVALEERQRIQTALDRLTPLDKKIVYLRYYLDQTIKDIARQTDLSESAVETRLWRSRQRLRALLDESCQRSVIR